MQLLAWPRESKGLNRRQTKHTCSDQWRWRMPALATPLKSSAVQRFRQLSGLLQTRAGTVPNEFLRAGFTGAACSGRASSLSCPDFGHLCMPDFAACT